MTHLFLPHPQPVGAARGGGAAWTCRFSLQGSHPRPGSGSLSHGRRLQPGPPSAAGHGWISQNNSFLAGSRRGRGPSHSKPVFFPVGHSAPQTSGRAGSPVFPGSWSSVVSTVAAGNLGRGRQRQETWERLRPARPTCWSLALCTRELTEPAGACKLIPSTVRGGAGSYRTSSHLPRGHRR